MRTAAMGMAVFMKTAEEAQRKLSGRMKQPKMKALRMAWRPCGRWGPFPSLCVGLGQGKGRSRALWHLQLFTCFPQDSFPMSET